MVWMVGGGKEGNIKNLKSIYPLDEGFLCYGC